MLSQRQIYLTSAHERRGMVHGPCLVCSLCVVPVPRSRRFYLSRAARMPLAVPLPASRLPCVHAGVCLGNCNDTAAWAGNCDHDCDQVGHRWVTSGGGLACGRDFGLGPSRVYDMCTWPQARPPVSEPSAGSGVWSRHGAGASRVFRSALPRRFRRVFGAARLFMLFS